MYLNSLLEKLFHVISVNVEESSPPSKPILASLHPTEIKKMENNYLLIEKMLSLLLYTKSNQCEEVHL